jgi:hypothetical protein
MQASFSRHRRHNRGTVECISERLCASSLRAVRMHTQCAISNRLATGWLHQSRSIVVPSREMFTLFTCSARSVAHSRAAARTCSPAATSLNCVSSVVE